MAEPILMPKLGQADEECTIVKWHKREGEPVRKGDVLFEVETEKAVLEVESFQEGTLLKILLREGESALVGTPIAFVGAPGEAVPAVPRRVAAAAPMPSPPLPHPAPEAPVATALGAPLPAAAPVVSPAPEPTRSRISPRARALARECAINPQSIRGTGPQGRVLERDVRAYLAERGYDKLRISPAARQLAIREGIDILEVRGTGEGGRILLRDIERALLERPRPLSRMRQLIARRLTESVLTAPHFFVTVEVDMTELLAWRAQLRAQGSAYSLTVFILKAVILALQEHPTVNSSTDGRTIRQHAAVHLGVATSVPEGLVVPVIRDAETLTLADLHAALETVVARAREGRLKPEEMTGSTFTVSNMGMLDVDNFTAIINPGESAILAVASVRQKPVVRTGRIEPRAVMKITLSADHRLIDGALAARFVNAIKRKLEDVELWKSLTS